MKTFLRKIVVWVSSTFKGKYAGKMIGFFDFCRNCICENKNVFAGQIHERMDINNVLPLVLSDNIESNEYYSIPATDKIKVRIIYPAGCSWNNIHTLYESFMNDEKYQTIVIVENYPRFIYIMEMVKCKYITLDHYDIKSDKPDILIASYYSSSNPEINFPGVHNYVKNIYAAIPNVVMNEKNYDIHWSFIHSAYEHMNPDYYLCEKPVYHSLLDYVDNSKLVELGNPQYDEIFREVGKSHPVPSSWKKLEGKKIFLWATDHGINESYPTNGFTVDLYLSKMLKYFNEHQEIGLIFRPHPQFIREMVQGGHFWKDSDMQRFRDFCNNSSNIVWDETHDYCCSFDMCDAFIVDLNCSITCAALTTGKPICRFMRDDIEEWMINTEIKECYYYAKGFNQCVIYIENICNNIDTKIELRKEGMRNSILHFDGQNGMRMKQFIDLQYNNGNHK